MNASAVAKVQIVCTTNIKKQKDSILLYLSVKRSFFSGDHLRTVRKLKKKTGTATSGVYPV